MTLCYNSPSTMSMIQWIEAKKDGQEHPESVIREIVSGFTTGRIPDYQMSAWLMAVVLRGMTMAETVALTSAMIESGKTLDLSSIPGIKLDKHSSGGVGDKVTLALVPIVAAAGVPMAKMSGHGLGHTGGTLDKLESIPSFRTHLSETEILAQVRRIGACICAQTDSIDPADRAIYALRDVTGTVASIPLIASSIMSKKIACGADAIVLDIKVGNGAFMKDVSQAKELAAACIEIAKAHGKRLSVFLTDMNRPLGRAVGNFIEIKEVADLLDGKPADGRLKELTFTLCAEALRLAGSPADIEKLIDSGEALNKAGEMIAAQGGDENAVFMLDPRSSGRIVKSDRSGYIQHIDALSVAQVAAALGAGREKKGDAVDPMAGVYLDRVCGDRVEGGEPIAALCTSRPERFTGEVEKQLLCAFEIGDRQVDPSPIVIERILSD